MIEKLGHLLKRLFSSKYREEMAMQERLKISRIKRGYIVDDSGEIELLAENGKKKTGIQIKWKKTGLKKVAWSFFYGQKELQLIDLDREEIIKKSPYLFAFYQVNYESENLAVLSYVNWESTGVYEVTTTEYRLRINLKTLMVTAGETGVSIDGTPHID